MSGIAQTQNSSVTWAASRGVRRLPDFLVVGAMKASTTAFYELLSMHPGVWLPVEKEPHYFTGRDYGSAEAHQRYARLFARAPEDALVGEASTGYTKLPHLGPTPQRIRETLGQPRMIYLIRDPVERIISNYQHSKVAGHYSAELTLAEAMECDPILVSASCYARQIAAYRAEFEEDSLLILTTDELHSSPVATMRRVEEFLGLSPFDAWPDRAPSRNSRADLERSVAASRLAPRALSNLASQVLPTQLKRSIKALAPVRASQSEISESERTNAYELISEDLAELVEMLGDQVTAWPSSIRLNGA